MSLDQLLEWIPKGGARRSAGPAGRVRSPAASRRHHHGRQRPLGRRAPTAARRGPSRRSRLGPRRRRNLRAARPRSPHALRVLRRELEASRRRGQHADDAAEALSRPRARDAAAQQHPLQRDRPRRGAGARRPHRAARCRAQDGEEHRHAVQHRAQLRRPHGDRRRGAARWCPLVFVRKTSTRIALRVSSTPPASPIPIC